MATLANGKVIAAKRTLAVMTSQAAFPAAVCMMVKRFRRRHLSALRHSRSYLVTFVAGYFLVFGMIESHAERRGGLGSAGVTTQLVTRTT